MLKPNVTVYSALTAHPQTFPLSAFIPDGISVAITTECCELIQCIHSAYTPSISLDRPVPKSASIITVYSLSSGFVINLIPSFSAICTCIRISSDIFSLLPASRISVLYPCPLSSLAAAAPSPPLFPVPHTASIRGLLFIPLQFNCTYFPHASDAQRASAIAAFSISTTDGIPISYIDILSIFAASAAFTIYSTIIPLSARHHFNTLSPSFINLFYLLLASFSYNIGNSTFFSIT